MTEINREIIEIFLSRVRNARRSNLEKVGFPEKTTARVADIETDCPRKIAETVSLEDAILARLQWMDEPQTWLDWDLLLEEPPAADLLQWPKSHFKATDQSSRPDWVSDTPMDGGRA